MSKPEDTLNEFCDAYQRGEPFDQKRLYEALKAEGYGRPWRCVCGWTAAPGRETEEEHRYGCSGCVGLEFVERTGPLGIPQAWASEVVTSRIPVEKTCDGTCEPMCAWCNEQADLAAENRG